MATEKLKIECDLVDDTGDGGIKLKMHEMHIHLPPPPEGFTYSVQVAGKLASVATTKVGDVK